MVTELSIPQAAISKNDKVSELINWKIVHKIPGRLRIRIPQLIGNSDYGNRLERLLLKTRAITDSRLNEMAGSLIIFYEEDSVTESAILDYLEQVIQLAAQAEINANSAETKEKETWQNMGLPVLAMVAALAGSPLEWPFFLIGGLVLAASVPLWQRSLQTITQQGQVNIDCLDLLWLSAQLAGGNYLAASLALNLGTIAENLRRDRLKKLENELYVLFEQEDQEIHWLSDRQHFAPLHPENKEIWLHTVEETALMKQAKPIAQGVILPTLLMSGGIALLTNDLGRASAVLPLDLGVSLRGITPLAVVSALTVAARTGIYIRNGRTLEKLAAVDTLVFTVKSLFNLIATEQTVDSFTKIIEKLQQQAFSWYVVIEGGEEKEQQWVEQLKTIKDNVYVAADREALDKFIEELHQKGRTIAWIDNTTGDDFTTNHAEVTISLANEFYESQADVILHKHDLPSLLYTLNVARHTLETAYSSLAIAIIPNLVAVSIGVIFGINPIIAVIINSGSAILAELNSLRSGILEY